MWVGCTFWILVFAFHSLLCFSVLWVKVHVYRGHCFLTAQSPFVRRITYNRRPLLIRWLLKGSGDEGRKIWGGWRGQVGVRDREEPVTRTCSHSHQDAVWNMALFFWSWEQSTCWRPEDMSSPHASFPLLSQRYHWLVPMWIRVLVFTLYECLYLDNSLFCVAPQKIKSCFSAPLSFSRDLIICDLFFRV